MSRRAYVAIVDHDEGTVTYETVTDSDTSLFQCYKLLWDRISDCPRISFTREETGEWFALRLHLMRTYRGQDDPRNVEFRAESTRKAVETWARSRLS